MKPTLSVDWDGTLVEHMWPGEGDWLPGAVDALHELVTMYRVVIFSCRVAAYEFGRENVLRPPAVTQREINYIRRMLDEAGLPQVEIWTRPFKLPAVAYVDDRAVHFKGRWERLMPKLRAMAGAEAYPED